MTAGASGLIVHGKTVMFERSCQRPGSLRRKQRENAHVSWICDLHRENQSVQTKQHASTLRSSSFRGFSEEGIYLLGK
jgi:hypothetical protein